MTICNWFIYPTNWNILFTITSKQCNTQFCFLQEQEGGNGCEQKVEKNHKRDDIDMYSRKVTIFDVGS
jgi:hypothetical protein